MLDILGIEYIIDHVVLEIKAQNEKKLLDIYITDALQALVNNIAQEAVEKRSYTQLTKRWLDIIEPQPPKVKEDTRSCKEIAKDIWKNIVRERG